MNGRKGVNEDVLDPFAIEHGWFVIEFPSMFVKAAAWIDVATRGRVDSTIRRLGLNDEPTCLRARTKWLADYCANYISLEYLAANAPFIYTEMQRQDLVETIRDVFIT